MLAPILTYGCVLVLLYNDMNLVQRAGSHVNLSFALVSIGAQEILKTCVSGNTSLVHGCYDM